MYHKTKKQLYMSEIDPLPSFFPQKRAFQISFPLYFQSSTLTKRLKTKEKPVKVHGCVGIFTKQFQVHSNWAEKHI